MHRCSVKKNWCALFERQFQSIILVTKVLKFRTFLFELYVLISIASVQTPLSLQKKKNNLGEAWTLQFFSRRGGFCTLAIIRDFKMPRRRRQRERQKSNGLKRQNNNSARASRFFCTFLCRHCTTTTGKCLISRFMEDVNRRQLRFLSLGKLEIRLKKSSLAFDKINEFE